MDLLERLGIDPGVRSFFAPYLRAAGDTVLFAYGNCIEHSGPCFHKIPITEAAWIAGVPQLATDIFVCGSAMDAVAWLNLNFQRFNCHSLCFIAAGALPCKSHAALIRPYVHGRKLHFIFSGDALGALCDLKLASWLRGKPLVITYEEHRFRLSFAHKTYVFEQLSIAALEKASGYNFRIRTHKPNRSLTFYEQLNRRY